MRTDIDNLMKEHNIDVLFITGPGHHNPAMTYMTGGGHFNQADLIKVIGNPPVLFHNSIEREEAAKTGLKTVCFSAYPWKELLEEANNDHMLAIVLRYARMFGDLGATKGTIAVYGQVDMGWGYEVIKSLQTVLPECTFIGTADDDVLWKAMATKDNNEIERIKRMGQITTDVVAKTAEFICQHHVSDGILLQPDGTPLTVSAVKNRINLWLAEAGVENPKDTIFSIGYDAAIPHSSGSPDDILVTGVPIIFDIFPCEAGGGYFIDLTRTWCIEYAVDEVEQLYSDVKTVREKILSEVRVGETFLSYQKRACEIFEDFGHPTILTDPATESGFVHSLGHGVGLKIHEFPLCREKSSQINTFVPGMVFAIEPGLYYPGKKMGVRLEDTFWINEQGRVEKLTEYPLDLVLKI